MIINDLVTNKGKKRFFIWLIDPDKDSYQSLETKLRIANDQKVDLIFAGGSLVFNPLDDLVNRIKSLSTIPVVIFPGSPLQLCSTADGILLLSLISGRNPEYLIGNHVISAPFLKASGMEIIPTGYILVDGGRETSVSYMSGSRPIPGDKEDIAIATAMAGEMLGLKVIYLDAGSGAMQKVPIPMIRSVAGSISVPLIVGGGIRSAADVREMYQAGADAVVVGNATEGSGLTITEMILERDRFNTGLANNQHQ